MCWLVGLGSTILRGDPISLCLNGSCSKTSSASSTAPGGQSNAKDLT